MALTTHELGQGFNVNELQYARCATDRDAASSRGHVGSERHDGRCEPRRHDAALSQQHRCRHAGDLAFFLPLDLINDVNNYLGRSQWPDPFFDGQIDEFAIYDAVLSPAEVAARFATGPVPTPIPTFVVDRTMGEISVENHTSINFNLKSYAISSVAGALDVAQWDSIADNADFNSGGGFDMIGIWTEQSATANELAESTTGNGGPLVATTGSWSLGEAWFRSPIEDLQVTYVLSDGSNGIADVSFVGNGGVPFPRSDLNADGSIDADDWTIFLASSDTSFAGQTAVQAYLGGDLDGDFDNDFRDFRLFQRDFIASNGEGAFAALFAGQIPEPSALALAAMGLAGLAFGAMSQVFLDDREPDVV